MHKNTCAYILFKNLLFNYLSIIFMCIISCVALHPYWEPDNKRFIEND
jgi:hypothetical protein